MSNLLGQNPSDKGWFSVDELAGCSEFNINLTHNDVRPGFLTIDFDGDPNDPFSGVGFDATVNPNQTISFPYTTAGTYLIRAVDQSGSGNDSFDFLTITVIEPSEPSFEIELCSGNQVAIIIDPNDDYDAYGITLGDGTDTAIIDKSTGTTFTYVYAVQGTYTINVSGLLNNGNTVNCGNAAPQSITTIDNIPTPVIEEVIADGLNAINITYQNLDPNINYQLETDFGSGFQVFTGIDPQVNPTNLIIDNSSIDNTNTSFSLRIAASDACNATPTYSDEISTIAFNYTLNPLTNQIPIEYSWSTSSTDFNGADFYQTGAQLFSITLASGSQIIDYDSCTELSEVFIEKIENGVLVRSRRAIPYQNETYSLPQMVTPNADVDGANVILNFENTVFPFSTIRIYRQNGDGDFDQIGTSSTLEYLDVGVSSNLTEACYITDYIDECGNVAAQSEEVCLPLEGLLRTPSAFSPNGDNLNDIFFVGSGIFDQFQLLIFNKWGNIVFQTDDISQGWDGYFGSKEAPIGTYQYKISYNSDGRIVITTGTVTLIR